MFAKPHKKKMFNVVQMKLLFTQIMQQWIKYFDHELLSAVKVKIFFVDGCTIAINYYEKSRLLSVKWFYDISNLQSGAAWL